MDIADFRTLYDYNSWANRRVLEACASLSTEQLTRHNDSSFPSVRDTLAHICGAEWIWLERWNGRVPTGGIPAATDYPDFETLRRRWTGIESDLLGYIASLKPADINRIVEFKSLAGIPFSQQLGHCLQHLANHSTYHRGQITTMLRQLGAKPTSTDLLLFYRERLTATTGA